MTHRLVVVVAFVALLSHRADAATLVQDGKPTATVVIPAKPDATEKLAADELISHIEKMSGAKLALSQLDVDPSRLDAFLETQHKANQTTICLGRFALPRVQKLIADKSDYPGTFALVAEKNHIFIAGLDNGAAIGVSELLEQQGVRWFMPGDLGTVIPDKKTIVVADQQTVQAPSFPSRWFQMPDKDWQVRVRCGGPSFPGAHGLPGLPKFKDAPELYSLIKGQRSPRQVCLSNPKVLELVVAEVKKRRAKGLGPTIGMGPNDGGGFCQCEHCKALDGDDFDPFSAEPSVTDRYIWFFNQVLEKVNADYPDTKLAFYIYHSYMRPPVRWKPDRRITGALAPIALDRVHGFSNPVAPEKSYTKWLYQEWGKLIPELYDRGYWSNLSDPGVPFIIVHRLRDEIPACHEFGLKGWRVETFPNYASQLPSNYVAAKLMWNHKADVDAILKDFAEKFFGPASEPMGKYVSLMDGALRDSPYVTGSAWDMPLHYPAKLRQDARALLNDAAKRSAGKGVYEQRVQLIMQTFDLLEAFIGVLEARSTGDFAAGQKQLERCDEVAGKLMAYKPVAMLSAGRFSTYVNYMRRFFRPATEQGYKRVTGGNELVATTADEWDFLIDPPKVGEQIGLWKPEIRGGNWQKIKTSSSSWSNQGLRYYKGLAWYRQTAQVPDKFAGKRIFLWCGGVDEKAKIWINGKMVGISPGAAFSPFEVDVTDAVKSGANVIVMAVNNDVVNELGTGGIVAPVMLYAPAAGKDAKLENVRPLGETFP
jgi:hypothetical protein